MKRAMGDATPPILEYAGARDDDERPPGSPIELVALDGGGVRLIDPPRGWWAVRNEVIAVALGCWITIAWTVSTVEGWARFVAEDQHVVRMHLSIFFAAITVLGGAVAAARARRPLVIEAEGGELRVELPALVWRTRRWRVERLRDVRASVPVVWVSIPPRMVSTLLIVTPGLRPVRLLQHRPAAEVRWVAREVRRALGIVG